MDYTWFETEAAVDIVEHRTDEFKIAVIVPGGEGKKDMGNMEKGAAGRYTAYYDGYFFRGDTKEEAVKKLIDYRQEQIRNEQEKREKALRHHEAILAKRKEREEAGTGEEWQ